MNFKTRTEAKAEEAGIVDVTETEEIGKTAIELTETLATTAAMTEVAIEDEDAAEVVAAVGDVEDTSAQTRETTTTSRNPRADNLRVSLTLLPLALKIIPK